MEILQLRYFYESAKTESFARTADAFMVPTTSVSASVKRLEAELGCRLFDRSCNRITLNENGRRLQRSLCAVFAELDGAVCDLSLGEEENREIRLLVRSMRRKITDRIIAYRALYPKTSFKTVFDFREIQSQDYDIIIDTESDCYPDFDRFPLFHMRLQLKCAATDPLCGQPLSMGQLSGRSFVTMGAESNLHRQLYRACARAGFTPDIAIQCNDIECYEKFIAAGMGIALGREKPEDAANGVAYLDVTDLEEYYTVYGYCRKHCHGTVKRFLDFLKADAQ